MKKNQNRFSVLAIAGGGTGGHVFAGVAIAKEWCRYQASENGVEGKVYFVGTRGGIEERIVEREGFSLFLLRLGGLKGKGLPKQLSSLMLLPWALICSLRILWQIRPVFVLGVGGFASGPFLLAAYLLRIPTGILEQNSVLGLTNKILLYFINIFFTSFESVNQLTKVRPRMKVVTSGNPIRQGSLTAYSPRESNSLRPFVIFVFGGSQGAIDINTLVLQALPFLEHAIMHISFIHQTGEKDYARVLDFYQRYRFPVQVKKFIVNMDWAYQESALVICRAGATTLAELAHVGRAAVLIPFPQASDNHQEKNARFFVNAQAAVMLKQNFATGQDLSELILRLYKKPETIFKMEQEMVRFARPNAAITIVQTILGDLLEK